MFRWYCTTYLCWYESLHRPINLISREREVLPAFVIVWYWSTYLDTWYCSAYLDTLPEGCLVLWQSWPQEEFKSVAILTTGQWWWLHNRIHFSIYIIHKPGCAIDNIKCNLKLTDLFYIGKSYRYISTSHFLTDSDRLFLFRIGSGRYGGMRAPKAKWLNYLLVLTLFNLTLHLCYVYFLLQVCQPWKKEVKLWVKERSHPQKQSQNLWAGGCSVNEICHWRFVFHFWKLRRMTLWTTLRATSTHLNRSTENLALLCLLFLDAIASPSTYPCQWVSDW